MRFAVTFILMQGELMLVHPFSTFFLPPYSELLRRKWDRFSQAGIRQVFELLSRKQLLQYDEYWLSHTKGDQNVSSVSLNPSVEFSRHDPRGKLAFYLTLTGFSMGIILFSAEIATRAVECVSI